MRITKNQSLETLTLARICIGGMVGALGTVGTISIVGCDESYFDNSQVRNNSSGTSNNVSHTPRLPFNNTPPSWGGSPCHTGTPLTPSIEGSFFSPLADDRVFGSSVTLSSSANLFYPNDGSVTIQTFYYLDGKEIANATSNNNPTQTTFDSTLFTNGLHTLTFSTLDLSGNFNRGIQTEIITIANHPPVSTASAGGTAETPFTEMAPMGSNLVALNVYSDTQVQQIQAVWAPGFGINPLKNETQGIAHGAPNGTLSTLNCAIFGPSYRVTGLSGRAGASVNTLSLICGDSTNESKSQTTHSVGDLSESPSGTPFELDCPANTFAVGIQGNSKTTLDQIQLLCQ